MSSISSPRSSSSSSSLSSTTARLMSDLSSLAYNDIYLLRNLAYLSTCSHDNFPLPKSICIPKGETCTVKLNTGIFTSSPSSNPPTSPSTKGSTNKEIDIRKQKREREKFLLHVREKERYKLLKKQPWISIGKCFLEIHKLANQSC